jgi:NAD(P)-dependent dehydrogenase (short-subunit alcohol dehydrogenase family)
MTKSFDTNVKGLLFTVQKSLPLSQDGGSIILTAATGSKPAFSAYCATKAAIRSFARGWRMRTGVGSHFDTHAAGFRRIATSSITARVIAIEE